MGSDGSGPLLLMQKDQYEKDFGGNRLLVYWTGTLSAPHPRRSITLKVLLRRGITAWAEELDVSLAPRTRHPYPIDCCWHRPLPASTPAFCRCAPPKSSHMRSIVATQHVVSKEHADGFGVEDLINRRSCVGDRNHRY
jgi:hypothetical protein